MKNNWFVYMLKCRDGSYYTGITTDVDRRVQQHRTGKGAKYTRAKGVMGLVWYTGGMDRSSALKLERWMKTWSRERKERFIVVSGPPVIK